MESNTQSTSTEGVTNTELVLSTKLEQFGQALTNALYSDLFLRELTAKLYKGANKSIGTQKNYNDWA
jgi:hypothetical protein